MDSTAPEHRSLVLGFCDRASACEANAKETIGALSHLLKCVESPFAALPVHTLTPLFLTDTESHQLSFRQPM